MQLRPYQEQAKAEIYQAWGSQGSNILAVMPTGAGKTVLLGSIIHEHKGASCCIAHRQELVGQISIALAREGVRHRIIAPKSVRNDIVRAHTRELGQSWFDPAAQAGVAGVDTLLRRADSLKDWMASVTLWVQDEAHHVLANNKWGKAAKLFPNAKGLGVTATPCRADGAGLGRWADGLFDAMVEGPTMRWLIDNGYLTDYRIFAPPSDIDLSAVDIGSTGDFSQPQLRAAAHKSHIVGDVVAHYQRIAGTRRGVVFAVDVKQATDIADRFNAAGTVAAIVSAKTSDHERARLIDQFRKGAIQVLVNVDLFGEGFDLPAIEVVSMARPTMSYALYIQQFGRALRLMEGKGRAIIIDHVGNVGDVDNPRHGLPDRARIWSLDRRERRGKNERDPDMIPTRACLNPLCTALYEAILKACPYCGHEHIPAGRSLPIQVDGDLQELDPDVLKAMRGEVARIDWSANELSDHLKRNGTSSMVRASVVKNHRKRQEMQGSLRDVLELWEDRQRVLRRSESESNKRFYFRYGIDVLSAQALGRPEAETLAVKIADDLFAMKG